MPEADDTIGRISAAVRGFETAALDVIPPNEQYSEDQPLRWLCLTADLAAASVTTIPSSSIPITIPKVVSANPVDWQLSANSGKGGYAVDTTLSYYVQEATGKVSYKSGEWLLCRPVMTAGGVAWEPMRGVAPGYGSQTGDISTSPITTTPTLYGGGNYQLDGTIITSNGAGGFTVSQGGQYLFQANACLRAIPTALDFVGQSYDWRIDVFINGTIYLSGIPLFGIASSIVSVVPGFGIGGVASYSSTSLCGFLPLSAGDQVDLRLSGVSGNVPQNLAHSTSSLQFVRNN